jgi:segregation and condensation protein A
MSVVEEQQALDLGLREPGDTASGYMVDTPAFTGPFDLLLQLITRHRVDIYDVPLRVIVDDYIAEIDLLEELDLNVATEFLLIAATLIELKTVALLPEPDDVDLDEELALFEQRDLLISRLLQAKTFRDASRVLERCLDEGSRFHPREAGLEERFLHVCPDLLAQVGPADLLSIAERVMAARPEPLIDLSHVSVSKASVRDAIGTLVHRMPHEGERTLRELAGGAGCRLDVLVVLLGLLELYKQGMVELRQAVTFGELRAEWVGDVDLVDIDELAGDWDVDDEPLGMALDDA